MAVEGANGSNPNTAVGNPNSTPELNDERIANLKAQHAIDHKFQLDMMEMQMGFQADQFWVTTLATINKANHDSKMELARKFG